MQHDVSRGDNVGSTGSVGMVRTPTSVYKEHLDAVLKSITLNPDDVKTQVMATLDADGDLRVKVFGRVANDTVSTSLDVSDTEQVRGALQVALDSVQDAIMEALKVAAATTLLAQILEGRTADGGN